MAETLTQEQIDALLSGALSGGVIETAPEPEVEIKEYDFKSPKRFTKERMKTLDSIFDNYSRLLSTYLTGLLRLYCQVNVAFIEEQKYFEFNNTLPDYVMMGLVELRLDDDEVEDLTVILQLSNSLTYTMIDRLLGGRGEYKDAERDFTEIEVSIMSGIFKTMCGLLREPWESYVDVHPELTQIETNSRVISAVGYDDAMIIVVLEIVINETKTLVSACMPALELDEIMQRFASKTTRPGKKGDANKEKERKANIYDQVAHSDLNVKAILGGIDLDLSEILSLQPGDIIPLEKDINANVELTIEGKKWFDGKLGIQNNKRAVRIENIFSEFDE